MPREKGIWQTAAPFRQRKGAMNQTTLLSQRLTCLFETGKSEISLDSVENLGDGRGYTCGWAGFTTADEEVRACVEEYSRLAPGNALEPLLPELESLHDEGSDDVAALDDANFPNLWREAAQTGEFASAYAQVVDEIFGRPALQHLEELNLQTPVAYAILFDSSIQHGNDDDPDSLPSMIDRTRQTQGEPDLENEAAWLGAFLEVRRQTLLHPHNRDTAKEWRGSVSRVEALENIANENPQLQLPISVKSSEHDEEIS